MSELKPCPFCGSENTVRLPYNDRADIERCKNCNLTIIVPFGYTMWNTRPIEDALHARIDELAQAVGLITTLKPTMVMDVDHPLDMAKEVAEYVTARIAELEAFIDQLIEIGEWGVTGMVIATSFSVGKIHDLAERRQNEWLTLVKDWKEREDSE